MEEKEYSVSEAVRLIGVESHVLRYWEEELSIEIRRNAQGHRIYSRENIDMFRQVRELKEKGLQLKAVRLLLDSQRRPDFGETAQEDGFAERIRELSAKDRAVRPDGRERTSDKPDYEMDGRERASNKPDYEMDGRERTSDKPAHEMDGRERTSDKPDHETDDMAESETVHGEIVPAGEPEPMRQFELILRRMMEEVVAEQNEKLEETIAMRIREELEEFYLQCEQITREAAAALETENERNGILRRALRRLFRKGR